MNYIPSYIKKNTITVKEKSDSTKCSIKCDCGCENFTLHNFEFEWDKNANDKFDKFNKIFVDKLNDFVNATLNKYRKKHPKIKFPFGLYNNRYYSVAVLPESKTDISTGEFLKSDECLGYMDMTEENIALEKAFDDIPDSYVYYYGVCNSCGKEIVLFDNRKHGHDGILIDHNPNKREKTYAKYSIKTKRGHCKESSYKIYITYYNTGKEDLILESDGSITEDNWVDAFEWIVIDIECGKCGKITKDWLNFETM